MKKEYIHELQTSALFAGMMPEDLRSLIACIQPVIRSVQKGGIVFTAGEPLVSIGLILKGEVEITHENAAGGKSLISWIGQGSTFGEVAAFAGQTVWPSTVAARKDSLLMFFPPQRFLGHCPRACAFHKTLIQNMLKILSEKALRLNRKVGYLEMKGIRQKLCNYLLEQRELHGTDAFILPINKSELADYLNISRPSMSRELGLMRKEGVLDFYLSSFRLLDVDAIGKIAVG